MFFSHFVINFVYKSSHVGFFDFLGGSSAAKIASSKTFFKPFYKKEIKFYKENFSVLFFLNRTCVNALHSTYLTALSSRANFSPCSNDIGF